MSVPAAFLRGTIWCHCSQIVAVTGKIAAGLALLAFVAGKELALWQASTREEKSGCLTQKSI